MTLSVSEWHDQVETAVLTKDGAALTLLYAEAKRIFGSDAGAHWAQALSAYDGTAITG